MAEDCMEVVLEFLSVVDHVYQLSRVCSDWRRYSIKFIMRYLENRSHTIMLGELKKQFESCFESSELGRRMRKFLTRCHVRDLAETFLNFSANEVMSQHVNILWVKSEMETLCNYLKVSKLIVNDIDSSTRTNSGFFTKLGKLFSKKTKTPNVIVGQLSKDTIIKNIDDIVMQSSIQGNLNDSERYHLVYDLMGIEFIPVYDDEGNLDESPFLRACPFGSTDLSLDLNDWFHMRWNIVYPKLTSDNLEPMRLLSHEHFLMISGISMQECGNISEITKELVLNKKLFKDDSCAVSNYEQVVVGVKLDNHLLSSQQFFQTAFNFDGLQYFEFSIGNSQIRVLYWYSVLMAYLLTFLNSG